MHKVRLTLWLPLGLTSTNVTVLDSEYRLFDY